MKRILLYLLLLVSTFLNAQEGTDFFWPLLKNVGVVPPPPTGNTAFSFQERPYSDVDQVNPGRGAEQWHNGSEAINNPTPNSLEPSKDLYYRFEWARLEGATLGSYTWKTNPSNNYFDNLIRGAINNGQQLSFGIMTFYSDGGFTSYAGADASYPLYLHNLMQASPNPDDRDVIAPSGNWMPNWNHPQYLGRLRALHDSLNAHILRTSYTAVSGPHAGQSIRYQDAIYCIDVRGFGDYGEWHSGGMYDFGSFPGNTQPTAATLMEIIDTHTEVFQNWPLSMMVAAYNTPRINNVGGTNIPLFHPYNQVAHYALDATNDWGQVGYRRDQFGALDNYLHQLLELNTGQWPIGQGLTVAQKFLNLYKTAPGTGEPLPGAAPINQMVDLENQVILYGSTSFGNGNWLGFPNGVTQDRIRAAWKRSGYRLKVTTGDAPQIITRGVPFQIKVNWQNVGITPAYNDWQVVYELQTGGGTVVWTGVSSKVLKLFRPDQGIVQTTDNLIVTASTSAGTYKLVIKVKDPVGFRSNMKLALQGMNSDISYTIFNSVVVN